jgi:uncharacterized cupredoxin-like copper-binding protein
MRRWLLFVPVLILAGCGGSGGSSSGSSGATTQAASQSGGAQSLAIAETEYTITPSTINVPKAGMVTFKVTNNGQIGHALEIEGHGVEQKTDTIDPGSSATLTVNLSKTGSYEVYCPVDDHKNKGMKATLTVGGTSGPAVGGTTTNQTTTDKKGGYGY